MTEKKPAPENSGPDTSTHDKLSDDDSRLFRAAVGEIRQLRQNKIEPETKKPGPVPTKTLEEQQQVLKDMLSDEYEPPETNASDYLLFVRPGLQHKTVRKLKRGQFTIEAELDLHGMTVSIAREQLSLFLADCKHNRWRCIRIIHGKGRGSRADGPVLKDRVNRWLPQRQDVLAFCSAIPAHGGTGAVYVLLKSR